MWRYHRGTFGFMKETLCCYLTTVFELYCVYPCSLPPIMIQQTYSDHTSYTNLKHIQTMQAAC